MNGYQISGNGVTDLSDGTYIAPDSMGHRQQAYQDWLTAGNKPLPADQVTPAPNLQGFVNTIKAAMGGIVGVNLLTRMYPSFYDALMAGQWADAQALLVDARITGVVSAQQYAGFQAAFTANNIPITLP